MDSPVRIVIAIGGNALVKEREVGTVAQQFANTRATVARVADLIDDGHEITLTHGNGPQVGNILIRVQAALDKAYPIPLGVAVAESQGEIGYMIAQTLKNELHMRKCEREVAVILTQVVCAADDPALLRPTKPVGPFYDADEAARLRDSGIAVAEDSGRGYRVVVPSPRPVRIVERKSIETLVAAGVIVIAAGGGGMPVYEQVDGTLEGIDGVVDKDLASALLANELGAEVVIFLTGASAVYVDFGKPTERALRCVTAAEMREHAAAGQFPEGSMGPKVEAALEFLARGGASALITSTDCLDESFQAGPGGTSRGDDRGHEEDGRNEHDGAIRGTWIVP